MLAHFAQGRVKLVSIANAFPGELLPSSQLVSALDQYCGHKVARKARAISKQIGVETRYFSRSLDQSFSLPQVDAPTLCQQAIEAANAVQSDYLITHTTSPHTLLPSNAAWVAEKIGFEKPYMELRQACTGFANALQIATAMLQNDDLISRICINASEVGSVYFNYEKEFVDVDQLINFMQMGDGASAVLLAKDDGSHNQIISDSYIGHIGVNHSPGFQLKGGGSQQTWCEKALPYFEHNAIDVRQQGPQLFLKGLEAIQGRGYQLDDFRFILPHQANGYIDRLLSELLNVDPDRIVNTAKKWGNLGSVAIWASLAELINSSELKPGDKVAVLGAEATKYMYGGFVYTH